MQHDMISSQRLDLILMSAEFLQASLANELTAAEALISATILPAWLDEKPLIRLRLAQIQHTPAYQPWSLRAIVLRDQRRMVGHIGFHTEPDPDYLQALAPGGVEFGYTVFPEFRRQGYALEASQAMIKWANEQQRVERFVLSISPENTPSLRIAERLGFVQIGSHVDEEDGPENIYELRFQIEGGSSQG